MGKSGAFGLLVAAAFLLAGCEFVREESVPAVETNKQAGGCPGAAVLAEASTVTKFRGAGRDPTDVVATAEIARPKLSCDYDNDTRQVELTLSFPLSIKRGPAGNDADVTVSYFVAVVDSDNNVVLKQGFDRDLAPDMASAGFDENPGRISFTAAKDKKAVSYEVLVGFQLSHDELAYNRTQRRFVP